MPSSSCEPFCEQRSSRQRMFRPPRHRPRLPLLRLRLRSPRWMMVSIDETVTTTATTTYGIFISLDDSGQDCERTSRTLRRTGRT